MAYLSGMQLCNTHVETETTDGFAIDSNVNAESSHAVCMPDIPDGLVVKASISETWIVLSMIWTPWVWSEVGLILGYKVLVSKSYLNPKYW